MDTRTAGHEPSDPHTARTRPGSGRSANTAALPSQQEALPVLHEDLAGRASHVHGRPRPSTPHPARPVDPVPRASRARRGPPLDRFGRRRVRQRPDGNRHRALQDRAHPHHGLPPQGPTGPTPTWSTRPQAGSAGTTTGSCTAASATSPPTSSNKRTTRPSTQSRNAQRSGTQPGTLHSDRPHPRPTTPVLMGCEAPRRHHDRSRA